MINVLQITGTVEGRAGGINNILSGFLNNFDKQKFKTKVIYGYGLNGYLNGFPKLVRKFDLLISPLLLKRKITNILRTNSIDIIHVHGLDAICDVAILSKWLKKKNIKTIATLHGLNKAVLDELKKEIFNRKIQFFKYIGTLIYFYFSARREKKAYCKIDMLTVVSSGIQKKLNNYYGLYAALVPNAIEKEKNKKKKTIYDRRYLGLKDEDKVILFIGVSPWLKGWQYFKKIISKKEKYIIVGCKVKEQKNIINIPYVNPDELMALLKIADCFVHTSITEAFGLVYLEAMSCKVPIVTFATDGSEELIENKKNGLVVPARDVNALRQAIDLILKDNNLRQEIIYNGLLKVEKYSFSKNVKLLENIYLKLLSQKKYLLIPHLVKENNRTRTEEIARALVRRGEDVSLLYWGQRNEKKYTISIANIFYLFKELLRRKKTEYYYGVKKIFLPRLIYPVYLATVFNSRQVNKFINNVKIEVVINAAFLYYKINNNAIEYIYDLVDDHVAYTGQNGRRGSQELATKMLKYIDGEMAKADKLLFVSPALKNKYSQYAKKSSVLLNGAYFAANNFSVQQLKEKYGLDKKYVFGLIGNHGEWSGLEEIINVFKKYAGQLKNTCLVIAGKVYNEDLVQKLPGNIKYLGALPAEKIPEIYFLIDAGIQSAVDDEFRNKTIPLKVMEYTAAKKMIVALAAQNLKQISLPNMLIAQREPEDILDKLLKVQKLKWQQTWLAKTEKYNWDNLIKDL